jgi:hypothetical protein
MDENRTSYEWIETPRRLEEITRILSQAETIGAAWGGEGDVHVEGDLLHKARAARRAPVNNPSPSRTNVPELPFNIS